MGKNAFFLIEKKQSQETVVDYSLNSNNVEVEAAKTRSTELIPLSNY